jgi:hypothetical protein
LYRAFQFVERGGGNRLDLEDAGLSLVSSKELKGWRVFMELDCLLTPS